MSRGPGAAQRFVLDRLAQSKSASPGSDGSTPTDQPAGAPAKGPPPPRRKASCAVAPSPSTAGRDHEGRSLGSRLLARLPLTAAERRADQAHSEARDRAPAGGGRLLRCLLRRDGRRRRGREPWLASSSAAARRRHDLLVRQVPGRQPPHPLGEQFERAKDANTRRPLRAGLARSGLGTWTPPARTTFAAAAEDWYAPNEKAETLRPQTRVARNCRSALDVWLLPALGGRYVASLRPSDVKTLRTRLAAAGKARRSRTPSASSAACSRRGVADRQLPHNPAALPKRGKRPGRALGRSSSRRMRRSTSPRGCERRGAARARAGRLARPPTPRRAARSTWADVDLDARQVIVPSQGRRRGARTVPMFRSARRVIIEQKVRSPFTAPARSHLPHRRRHGAPPGRLGAARVPRSRRSAGLRETPRLRPAPLRRLPPGRAGRQRPPRLQGGRPCEGEHHPGRLRAPVRGRSGGGRRGLRSARPRGETRLVVDE